MKTTCTILGLSAVVLLGGCSSRPIAKTWGHVKNAYHTTKQVYHTTKEVAKTTRSVAELVNPLEYIYVSQHGEALTPQGEVFLAREALLEPQAESRD